jgi:hypothetical protein
MNSGIFSVQAGQSAVYTGLLTKDAVMRSKESKAVPQITSGEFARLVGGSHELLGASHIKGLMGLRRRQKEEPETGAGMSGGGRLHRYLK